MFVLPWNSNVGHSFELPRTSRVGMILFEFLRTSSIGQLCELPRTSSVRLLLVLPKLPSIGQFIEFPSTTSVGQCLSFRDLKCWAVVCTFLEF